MGTAKTTSQSWINLAGSPQMSTRMDLTLVVVPVPWQRLPIGVQIIVPPWRKDVALPIAYSLEKAGADSVAAARLGETMQIDLPDVVAAVRSAFERYEQALVSNNVAELDTPFHHDGRTIRYGIAENLYGHAEVAAFRARRSPQGPVAHSRQNRDHDLWSRLRRRLHAVLSRQHTWEGGSLPEGWRIVAAHVSLIDDPAKGQAGVDELASLVAATKVGQLPRSRCCGRW